MDCVVDLEKHMTADSLHSPSSLHLNKVKDPCHRNSLVASPGRRIASIRLVARHPQVYEPCDDSFALVDALLADKVNLLEQKPNICVEVGCGSGYVVTSLALMVGSEGNSQFIATDISQAAAQVTRETLAAHGVIADVVVTDLVTGLEKRLAGSVDVLLFNPPYVPTPENELKLVVDTSRGEWLQFVAAMHDDSTNKVGAVGITSTWAGGERGRVVIDRMLTKVDNLMSSKGWFYMVTLTANNPSEICQIMKKKGFASRIVIQRYTEEENLLVLKFWRDNVDYDYDYSSDSGGLATTPPQSSLSSRMSRFAFWR